MITLARWEWFEQWQDERVKKRGDDYESFKNAIGKRIWQQVLALYPHLEDKICCLRHDVRARICQHMLHACTATYLYMYPVDAEMIATGRIFRGRFTGHQPLLHRLGSWRNLRP